MPDINYDYIAVEGIIGTGKTSLVNMLCKDLPATGVREEFAENPFLPLFYSNPEKYGFTVEMSFLAERYAQLKKRLSSADLFRPVISDYTFSKSLLFARTNLNEDEYELFKKMYGIISPNLPQPGVVLYLYKDPESAKRQIVMRARDYEQNIDTEYLSNLQKAYFKYFEQNRKMKVVIVDTTEMDFVQNERDYLYLKGLLTKNYPPGITRIIPEKRLGEK